MPAEAAAEAPPTRNECVDKEQSWKHSLRIVDNLERVRNDPSEKENSGADDNLEDSDGRDVLNWWKHETGQDLLNVRANLIVEPILNGSVLDFLMKIWTTPS